MGAMSKAVLTMLGALSVLAFAGVAEAQTGAHAGSSGRPRCWTVDHSTGLRRPAVFLPAGCPRHGASAWLFRRVSYARSEGSPLGVTTPVRPVRIADTPCTRYDPELGLMVPRWGEDCWRRARTASTTSTTSSRAITTRATASSASSRTGSVTPPGASTRASVRREPPRCTYFDPVEIRIRAIEPPPPGCAPRRAPRPRIDPETGLMTPSF